MEENNAPPHGIRGWGTNCGKLAPFDEHQETPKDAANVGRKELSQR